MKTKTSERTRLEKRAVKTVQTEWDYLDSSRQDVIEMLMRFGEQESRRAVRKALKEAATVAWSYDLATAVPLQRQIARSIEKEILALSRRKK